MAICPVIVHFTTKRARSMRDVACELRAQYGCAETISANVLNWTRWRAIWGTRCVYLVRRWSEHRNLLHANTQGECCSRRRGQAGKKEYWGSWQEWLPFKEGVRAHSKPNTPPPHHNTHTQQSTRQPPQCRTCQESGNGWLSSHCFRIGAGGHYLLECTAQFSRRSLAEFQGNGQRSPPRARV